MSDCREFYAWVKTVLDARPSPRLPDCDSGMESCCSELILSGDRPPFAAVAGRKAGSARQEADDDCGMPEPHECWDAKHQRLCTPPSIYGEWRVDSTYAGQEGKSFEVLQFIGGRNDAIEWLHSSAGRAWRRNALHVALMRFTKPAAAGVPLDPGVPTGKGVIEAYATVGNPRAVFPDCEWRCDYKHIAVWGDDEADRWLPLHAFSLMSMTKRQLTGMLSGGQLEDQVAAMQAATRSVSRSRRREIRAQASDIAALKAVVHPRDQLLDKPATMALLDRVRRELRFPIMRIKWLVGSDRPWNVLPHLPLAIKPGEPLFPAHASMPGGHAVLAHALAKLLASVLPRRAKRYERRAKRVCDNRVVAGLHWPVDMDVGRLIGELFADELLKIQRMNDLLALVKAEWE